MGIHGDGVEHVRPQLHRHGEDAHHVSADGHEASLPQGELPGKAVGHVHGQPDDGIDEAQVDDTPDIGIYFCLHKARQAEQNDQSGNGEHDISFIIHDYTFSVVFSPNKPVGL